MHKSLYKDNQSFSKRVEYKASCICSFSKGFIVGYEQLNYLTVYNLKDERLKYHKSYRFNYENFAKVVSMQTGPEDSYVAFSVMHYCKHI